MEKTTLSAFAPSRILLALLRAWEKCLCSTGWAAKIRIFGPNLVSIDDLGGDATLARHLEKTIEDSMQYPGTNSGDGDSRKRAPVGLCQNNISIVPKYTGGIGPCVKPFIAGNWKNETKTPDEGASVLC
jgi:hypothetical protein